MASFPLLFGLIGLIVVGIVLPRQRRRLPPGPPGLPLIGNIWDLPKAHEWLAYQAWGRMYGSDIIHLKLFGTHLIVLNSAQATKDIFEKRSNIYSDRVETVMIHELSGWHRNVGFMPYGDWWRANRRAFHQYFRAQSVPAFHPQITNEVHKLLQCVLETPAEFLKHYRYMTGALSLDVSYGLEIQPQHDPILETAEKGSQALFQMANAGSYLVDILPIMKHIPSWFPGALFKRDAEEWRKLVDSLYHVPYEKAKNRWESGQLRPSLAAQLFQAAQENKLGDEETAKDLIMDVAGIGYAAGADTTRFSLETFTFAMLLYPEVQERAYEEIDRLTGSYRLPTIEDQASLPYITAVMKESTRWRPVAPLAVAHRSTADDEYKGYFMPKGSVVIGNTWAILRDEARYPNPDVFNPSRFLTADGKLDSSVPDPIEAFGYGRRICPGRHFALDVLWLAIANILATFKIEKAVDEFGKVVEPKDDFTTGMFSVPKSVDASLQPRSDKAERLIRAVAVENE